MERSTLSDPAVGVPDYYMEYNGFALDKPIFRNRACFMFFWVLADVFARSPDVTKDLILKIAGTLPVSCAHADLALVGNQTRKQQLGRRYIGLDIPDISGHAIDLGDRASGAYWLTAFGGRLAAQLESNDKLRRALPADSRLSTLEAKKIAVLLSDLPKRGDRNKQEARKERCYRGYWMRMAFFTFRARPCISRTRTQLPTAICKENGIDDLSMESGEGVNDAFSVDRASQIALDGIVSIHAQEAASLCETRTAQLRLPHVNLDALARLDERLVAHIDGLSVAGARAQGALDAELEDASVGAAFTARGPSDRSSRTGVVAAPADACERERPRPPRLDCRARLGRTPPPARHGTRPVEERGSSNSLRRSLGLRDAPR